MKIPFDIKYRPQIESGEYKVETRNGYKAKIIYWELKGHCPIVAIINTPYSGMGERVSKFGENGREYLDVDSSSDLFIVLPEPELTSFDIDGLHGMVSKVFLDHLTDSDDHGNKHLSIAICNLQADIDKVFESFKELEDEKRR